METSPPLLRNSGPLSRLIGPLTLLRTSMAPPAVKKSAPSMEIVPSCVALPVVRMLIAPAPETLNRLASMSSVPVVPPLLSPMVMEVKTVPACRAPAVTVTPET